MTPTAILPDFGFSNGRDVSLCSVSHASGSISAFSVVLTALYGSFAPRKLAWRTKKLSSLVSVSMNQQAMPSAPSLINSPVWGLNTSTPFNLTRRLPSSSDDSVMSASPKKANKLPLPAGQGAKRKGVRPLSGVTS